MTEENKPGNEEPNTTEKPSNAGDIYAEGNIQDTDTRHQEAKRGERLTRYQRWQVGLAIVAAILAALGLCILYMQTKLVSRQIGIMKTQTTLTGKAMKRADKRSKAALKASTERSQASLEASAAQSKAALDASIKASRLDQRAWVGLKSGRLVTFEANKPITAVVVLTNTGKTIALAARKKLAIHGSATGVDINRLASRELSRVTAAPSILYPNLDISMYVSTHRPATEEEIRRINAGTGFIYVFGEMRYTDIFDRPHVTLFCGVYNPTVKLFDLCRQHNRAD